MCNNPGENAGLNCKKKSDNKKRCTKKIEKIKGKRRVEDSREVTFKAK